MVRRTRVQLLEMTGNNVGLRKWLGARGGTHVRTVGMGTRHTQGVPHMEWVWTSGDGVEEDVQLSDLIPVTTSQMNEGEAGLICHSRDVVVIDEPSDWPGPVSWESPDNEWTFPADRVVGEQFTYTGLEVCTQNSRRRAWRHSMVHLRVTGATAVLYTYSDCTLLRSAAGRASSAYGWLSAGCADAELVKEVTGTSLSMSPNGTWTPLKRAPGGEASLMAPAQTSPHSEVRRLGCLPRCNM